MHNKEAFRQHSGLMFAPVADHFTRTRCRISILFMSTQSSVSCANTLSDSIETNIGSPRCRPNYNTHAQITRRQLLGAHSSANRIANYNLEKPRNSAVAQKWRTLCKIYTGVADPINPLLPHRCYHAEFGRSRSNRVGISMGSSGIGGHG